MRGAVLAILTVAVVALADASAAQERGLVYDDPPPMNRTVQDRVRPQVEALLEDLAAEGRDYRLDGVEVFAASDKFLPGKIAIGMSHVLPGVWRTFGGCPN